MKKRPRAKGRTTLKKWLYAFAFVWMVILTAGVAIYSAYRPLKLFIALLLVFIASPIASALLSLFTVSTIALLRKWEI